MVMSVTSAPSKPPGFVGFFNPIARRLLRVGPLMGPNALITVRGRKTGELRTTPVAVADIGGRKWVIGTFGETNWVRNLRAAGEATLTVGRTRQHVTAIELDPRARAAFFQDQLRPYALHLPGGRLLLSLLGAGEIVDDPVAAAATRPVFELRAT